jgi:uncharacterized protein (DUF1330 family)
MGLQWYNDKDYEINRCVRQRASRDGSLFLFEGESSPALAGGPPPAFLLKFQPVGTVDATDQEAYRAHIDALSTSISAYGGSVLFDTERRFDHSKVQQMGKDARLPWMTTLEGDMDLDAALGLRFNSWEEAERWYDETDTAQAPFNSSTTSFLLEGWGGE